MKYQCLFIGFLLCLSCFSYGQLPSPDLVELDEHRVLVQPVLHGALVLDIDGYVIYVDPYGGKKAYKQLPKPALVLITDIHGDHLHEPTLNELDLDKAKIIAPKAVQNKISEKLKQNVQMLNNGDSTLIGKMYIKAIPMYNLPENNESRHPKGRGNGYVIQIGQNNIYISGDTEDIQEMRKLKNIDIAFVCMNLPYTMSVEQAASAVNEFQPKIGIPLSLPWFKWFE